VSVRFYCPDLAQNGKLRLGVDESKHLSRVCRLGVGAIVEVFDGQGHATQAQVIKVENSGVELISIGLSLLERLAPCALTLASAVPKGDRFDWLVEKATELGIERFIPIITERSVVEPGGAKLERLRKVIVEASKQSRRNRLMILDPPAPWLQVVELFPDSTRFLADPEGISTSRWPRVPPGEPVVLAVGPEGGFTEPERREAQLAGWLELSLGAGIMRIETAGIAGCAGLFTRVREPDP
jgi:16S rRNA (uracil1498-N3)-methyltransferase